MMIHIVHLMYNTTLHAYISNTFHSKYIYLLFEGEFTYMSSLNPTSPNYIRIVSACPQLSSVKVIGYYSIMIV
jgi:hypothetical protein